MPEAPQTDRPLGLTILAILNLVFGAMAVLSVGLLIIAIRLHGDPGATGGLEPRLAEKMLVLPEWFLWTELCASAVKAVLFVASALGYLGQKRFLGRTVGTAYAVASIADSLMAIFGLGTGFNIEAAIGLGYPTITLILIHSVFRGDLTR